MGEQSESPQLQQVNVDVDCARNKKGLGDQGKEVLDRQLDGLPSEDDNGTIYAYVMPFDFVLMATSCISAIIAGALNPLLTVIYGQIVGSFQAFSNRSISGKELSSDISRFTIYFVYLAIGEFVFVYIATIGFYYTGERITRRLRRAYFGAIIRQNMAFFDTLSAGEVTTRITSDMNLIQEGITSKISLCFTAAATFTAAFVISFIEYWKLGLILSSAAVAMTAAGATGAAHAIRYTKRSLASYSSGATIAEEAILSIRHVSAFGIQDALAQRYFAYVLDAEKPSVRAGIIVALMVSVMYGVPYLSYGLSFWQGSRFIVSGDISTAGVVTITLAIVIGAFAVGKVTPNAQALISSVAGATGILKAISRRSPQDPFSVNGLELGTVKGDITFRDVSLVYPSRPNVVVLEDLNLEIRAGKTIAVVGASGCGKSSIVGLIERFYEPTKGHIMLDGHDIQSLNLRWMRHQMSYVSQEPVLFDTTIFENIRHGLPDTANEIGIEDLRGLVVAAAKNANAHDFIMALPKGYETEVGERGLRLSGGQKQRIAIARALIRNPIILLLDEATSAMDVKSERAVQKALESASKGRTTIVIAHRLSTIRNADNIIVMSKGCAVEQGQHDDLMMREGLYSSLVNQQQISQTTRAASRYIKDPDAQGDDVPVVLNEKGSMGNMGSMSGSDNTIEKASSRTSQENHGEVIGAPRPSLWALVNAIGKLARPERSFIFIGLCCSIISGLGTPLHSIFFAKLIDALSLPPSSYDRLRKYADFWCLMYLMLGIVGFAVRLGQGVCFSYSSEKLTSRVRDQSFRSILRQDVVFFDEKQHSTGALTAFLSTGATHLNSLNGAILGSILAFSSTIIGGIVLSLVVGWKLALVCSATIPVVAGCGWVRLKMLAVFDDKIRKTHQESATYANEVISAIRTVASLGLEKYALNYYSSFLDLQAAKSLRSILQVSVLYAASQSCVFLCAALGFWYGGTLIASHEYTMLQFFICFAALISGSQSAGSIFSFAPDMSKALHAGRDLMALFDRRPDIDTWDPVGKRIENEKCHGRIEIENVSFRYPARPERLVLDNFSLSIQPGQYIALVGPSGCGKSTIISLLERFFDPTGGQIRVDGDDISKVNINDYRRLVSLVGQEPMIYQGTIRENMLLGSAPNVSAEDVVQACKEANIYDFIVSLPDGFSTVVGPQGNLLSGGQKQRIAIARALLRQPRILLLDEATSALDSESEKVVQDALDAAAQRGTTIAVAHRLSTIQKADLICVLDNGRLVESGTHAELMARREAYFELVEMQRLGLEASPLQ
ncbi:hypothetical protein GP486_005401 [Trichoglossum hirsutum]|uniref:Uncharacterized protein n=1 Tax=Trichoglossum hirsutum TaxID=265104 RepID=A0A9P8RMB6_9PEZI|nr:hypothetical protein GP486_005401 [Trichoglossum hirsutum]